MLFCVVVFCVVLRSILWMSLCSLFMFSLISGVFWLKVVVEVGVFLSYSDKVVLSFLGIFLV